MPTSIEKIPGRVLLPFEEAEHFLQAELQERFNIGEPNSRYGKLLYYKEALDNEKGIEPRGSLDNDKGIEGAPNIYFARTQMLEPFILHFDSIGEAATALKNIQRSWAPYQYQFFRRAELIQQKLPYINLREREFPVKIRVGPTGPSPIGLYTLIDEKTILASAATTSFLPAGKITFKEDHVNPPSRAYLKLQEGLALANNFFGVEYPTVGSVCFEAGACPGGWTWVLTNLGANVIAVDRSQLDARLMGNPLVKFIEHDAFTLPPQDIGKCDWVFSDVICYPQRLYEWACKWLDSGLVKNMICTIKMQGGIDWQAAQRFAEIPNSRVVHLNYNKHELTWIHCEQ